jgi:hypothetical protein
LAYGFQAEDKMRYLKQVTKIRSQVLFMVTIVNPASMFRANYSRINLQLITTAFICQG